MFKDGLEIHSCVDTYTHIKLKDGLQIHTYLCILTFMSYFVLVSYCCLWKGFVNSKTDQLCHCNHLIVNGTTLCGCW